MKTILKISLLLTGIGLLCFLGYKVANKITYKKEVAQLLNTVPEFSFTTLEGKNFTKNDLNQDKAIVFIYFNSTCDYCQHEAKSIQQNAEKFKNTQLIFVSYETKELIHQFSENYKLNNYDHITFLSDIKDDFANRFDANSIPYILIYSKDQQLVKRHKGQLSVETMLSFIE